MLLMSYSNAVARETVVESAAGKWFRSIYFSVKAIHDSGQVRIFATLNLIPMVTKFTKTSEKFAKRGPEKCTGVNEKIHQNCIGKHMNKVAEWGPFFHRITS